MPRFFKRIVGWLCLLAWLGGSAIGLAQETNEPPEPQPFSKAQIVTLLEGGVSNLDVMMEARERGLDFVVDATVVEEFLKRGADDRLLKELSECARPLTEARRAASRHLGDKKFDEAVAGFNALLEQSPRLLDAVLGRALAYRGKGDFEKAISDFNRVLELEPDSPAVLMLRARCAADKGDDPAALKDFAGVIESKRGSSLLRSIASREQGLIHQRNGRYEDARTGFREAVKLFPKAPESYARLAFLLATCPLGSLRDNQTAEELARTALELGEPKSVQAAHALDALAAAFADRGDFSQAESLESQAIALLDQADASPFQERRALYKSKKTYRLPLKIAADDPRPASLAELFLSDMVSLEGGTFQMGADWYEDDERPVHPVTLSPFRIKAHEVTVREWALVLGGNVEEGEHLPKDWVSWEDCQRFVTALNARIGADPPIFRLPTEAEWEFAARAKTDTAYHFGDDPNDLPAYAWFAGNAEGKVHPVGQKKPNAFGLYDVYGNVAEWCLDPYEDYAKEPATNPGKNAKPGELRTFRGGSRLNSARLCRSTARGLAPEKQRRRGVGFRLVAEAVPDLATLAGPKTMPPMGVDQAIKELTEQVAVENTPSARKSLIELLYLRGQTQCRRREYAAAIADFTRVLEISPVANLDYAIASRCHLAWIYATADAQGVRNGETAYRYAEKSNSLLYNTPTSWLALTTLAAAHAELGEFDKAIERAEQAQDRAPEKFRDQTRRWLKQYQANRPVRTNELPLPISELNFGKVE